MSNNIRGNLYVGLSGIQLPVPKYRFPPDYQQTSRLTYYASFFNSIEVNSSFYKIPRAPTLLRWCSSVPKDFRFTFKLYREATHTKSIAFDGDQVRRFMEVTSAVGDQCGCILVQFPPSVSSDRFPQLEAILKVIEESNTSKLWRVAVEFRNIDWYNNDTYDLLAAYKATAVIHDMKPSATPPHAISDFVYVRFHGPTGNYRGSYTHEFLQEYTEYINEWLTEGKTVYLYFNNTAGDAFNNLRTLQQMLNRI